MKFINLIPQLIKHIFCAQKPHVANFFQYWTPRIQNVSVHECSVTLCDSMDSSLGSSVHGIVQAKNTRVGCHFLLRGSSQQSGKTQVSCVPCIGRLRIFLMFHKILLGNTILEEKENEFSILNDYPSSYIKHIPI